MSIASEFSKILKKGVTIPREDSQLITMCNLFKSEKLSAKSKNMYSAGLIYLVKTSSNNNKIIIMANGYDSYKDSIIFINSDGSIGPVYMCNPILDADLKY